MDKNRLEYEMKKRNVSVSEICEVAGFSKSAYYRKCNGASDFTQAEIQRIVDFLGLDTPVGIFFTPKVS